MNIKYQCFISSTFEDLKEERMQCMNAILNSGHIPAGMEYFKAGRPQQEIIEKWIDESDIVILILGGRYGTVERGSTKSYTEKEYDYAIDQHKKVFSVVLADDYLHRKQELYEKQESRLRAFETKHRKAYRQFKDKVTITECAFVHSLEEIGSKVQAVLAEIVRERELPDKGWVKYDPQTIMDVLNIDMGRIKLENKDKILQALLEDKLSCKGKITEGVLRIAPRYLEILNQYQDSLGSYLESLTRSLELVLYDQYIEVNNTTRLVFIDENGSMESFDFNPWLYEGIETESYSFIGVRYNDKDVFSESVLKGTPHYTANPFYVTDVKKIHIPFQRELRKHSVWYRTNYKVDYDRFFHEYVFEKFCEWFHLNIVLTDRRTERQNREYMIKWGMFTPYKEIDHSSTTMLHNRKDRVEFDIENLMIPGNGYVVTLNSTSPGKIKMMTER